MANLIYDSKLSFGKVDLSGLDTEFPNILNIGKAEDRNDYYPGKERTDVNRMTCDIFINSTYTSGDGTIYVYGGYTESDVSKKVGELVFVYQDWKKTQPLQAAISPNDYQFFKVGYTTDIMTGSAECFLNTYAGK
jgi:hypothetical protein